MANEHFVYVPHTWSSDKVKDSQGNIVFKVKWPILGCTRISIRDVQGNEVIRMRQKWTWWNSKWDIEHLKMKYKVKEKSGKKLNVYGGSTSPELTIQKTRKTINILQKNLIVAKIDKITSCCSSSTYEIMVGRSVDVGLVVAVFLVVYDLRKQRQEKEATFEAAVEIAVSVITS